MWVCVSLFTRNRTREREREKSELGSCEVGEESDWVCYSIDSFLLLASQTTDSIYVMYMLYPAYTHGSR